MKTYTNQDEICIVLNKSEALWLQAMLYRCGFGFQLKESLGEISGIYSHLETFTKQHPNDKCIEEHGGSFYPSPVLIEMIRNLP